MNWKLIKMASLATLGTGTVIGITVGFILANKVTQIKTNDTNTKSIALVGFEDKLASISEEQIKVLSRVYPSKTKKATAITALTNEVVSKWKIAGVSATFELVANSWTADDTDGSLTYQIKASKVGKTDRTINITFAADTFLTTAKELILNKKKLIQAWLKAGADGRPTQKYKDYNRVNIKKLIFGSVIPGTPTKADAVTQPNAATIATNLNNARITLPNGIEKAKTVVTIATWTVGTVYKNKSIGNIKIKIKLTYDTDQIVLYDYYEIQGLAPPTA